MGGQMTVECKKGHGEMKLRNGVKGSFYGCVKYPECRETTQNPNAESTPEPTKTTTLEPDAKDRTFMAQTSWNAAATVTAARISSIKEDIPFDDIKSMADAIYKDLMEKRNG